MPKLYDFNAETGDFRLETQRAENLASHIETVNGALFLIFLALAAYGIYRVMHG